MSDLRGYRGDGPGMSGDHIRPHARHHSPDIVVADQIQSCHARQMDIEMLAHGVPCARAFDPRLRRARTGETHKLAVR
ncbi:hypothetical protein D3C80_1830910 [compost metagenome]